MPLGYYEWEGEDGLVRANGFPHGGERDMYLLAKVSKCGIIALWFRELIRIGSGRNAY